MGFPKLPPLKTGALSVLLATTGLLALDRAFAVATSDAGEGGLGVLGTLTLAGAHAGAVLAIAGASVALLLIGRVLSAGTKHRMSPSLARAVAAGVAVALAMYPVGNDLGSGAWVSSTSYGKLVRFAPSVAGGVFVAVVAWTGAVVHARADSRPLWWRLHSAGLAILCLVLSGANVLLWFGLYPYLHIALYGLSVVCALVATHLPATWLAARLRGLSHPASLGGQLVLIVLLIGLWTAMGRATRAEILTQSVTAADAIRKLSPSVRTHSLLHETLAHLRMDRDHTQATAEPARGLIRVPDDWNVVLIICDATRADSLPPVRGPGQKHATAEDTPFLDQWLEDAFRFPYAYSQAANTTRSIPPFFRSLQPYENASKLGEPLADYMRSLGRTPIAVFNNLFLEPRRAELKALLKGFDHVSVYDKSNQEPIVSETLKLVRETQPQPFFAWIHFYALHAPGYADGHILTTEDGSMYRRYRRSLKWVDSQMAEMFQGFEEMGLMDKTIFVITADHGQSLGDNRDKSNGTSVFEESVRVPLSIKIPGMKGRIIQDAVVGNIDVIPTLADLLGAPKNPLHRGTSLVPLLANPDTAWDRDYYLKSRTEEIAGVVQGRQKLIHDREGEAIFRFDLRTDPKENRNLFDPEGDVDQRLLRRFLLHDPERFRDELAKPAIQASLLQRLEEADANLPSETFDFLLRLTALRPFKGAMARASTIFDSTTQLDMRLRIVARLFGSNRRLWAKKLKQLIQTVQGTEEELELVRKLALQGQPLFAQGFISSRMQWWAEQGDASSWEPWLQLTRAWKKREPDQFAPALELMLARSSRDWNAACPPVGEDGARESTCRPLDAPLLVRILENARSLELGKGTEANREMKDAVLPFLDYPVETVQVAACDVLGKTGDQETSGILRSKFDREEESPRLRQAYLNAITEIDGKGAIPLILANKEDPFLLYDVLNLLEKTRCKEGLSFIEGIAAEHYSPTVRRRAAAAYQRISGKKPPHKRPR